MNIAILGADGYIGFNLMMYLANRGHDVVGMDNYSRRLLVNEVGGNSLTPIRDPPQRVAAFHERFGVTLKLGFGEMMSFDTLKLWLKNNEPDAIVHLAEQPSAPFSMMDAHRANRTQQVNVIGTLNLLWAMKEACPKAHLVKLGCYDDQTEVLTKNGWKLFKEIEFSDEICCLDPETERIHYSKPQHIVSYPYVGDMFHIKTRSLDLMVTPNHRIVYRHINRLARGRVPGPIHIANPDKLYGKNFAIPRSGVWEAEDIEDFELPEMSVRSFGGYRQLATVQVYRMDDWLNFFGWYVTEGCVRYRGEPTEVILDQQTDSENADRIRNAMNRLHLHWVESNRPDGTTQFSIANNHLANYLAQFGKSHEKFIPAKLKNISKRQLCILFNSLMAGDGHINARGSKYYHSKSLRLLGDVQEIVMKLGMAGTICSHYRPKRGITEYYLSIADQTNNYSLVKTGNPEEKAHGRTSQTWEPYSGVVYCCTVPSGIIMVRRNGRACWSGNTLGEYGTPNVDIPEGYFEIEYKGRKDRLPFPMQPGSFYHITKAQDTLNIAFACKTWDLCSTDLMQGPVYGAKTQESRTDERLLSRLDYDAVFGTVINRYVAQAVAGLPLTPYGSGGQTRGFIYIEDTLRCIEVCIENPPQPGEHRVFNQFFELYSVLDLAKKVKEICGKRGIDVEVKPIDNPRVEAEKHHYNPSNEGLLNLGVKPHLLDAMLPVFIDDVIPYKDRINPDCILPRVTWK